MIDWPFFVFQMSVKLTHHGSISAITQRFEHDWTDVKTETVNRSAGHDEVRRARVPRREPAHIIIGCGSGGDWP